MRTGTISLFSAGAEQRAETKAGAKARRQAFKRVFEIACLIYLPAWMCSIAYGLASFPRTYNDFWLEYAIGLGCLLPLALRRDLRLYLKTILVAIAALVAVVVVRGQWYFDQVVIYRTDEPMANVLQALYGAHFLAAPILIFLALPDTRNKWEGWVKLLWSILLINVATFAGVFASAYIPYGAGMIASFGIAVAIGAMASLPFLSRPISGRVNLKVVLLCAAFMAVAWWSSTSGYFSILGLFPQPRAPVVNVSHGPLPPPERL